MVVMCVVVVLVVMVVVVMVVIVVVGVMAYIKRGRDCKALTVRPS